MPCATTSWCCTTSPNTGSTTARLGHRGVAALAEGRRHHGATRGVHPLIAEETTLIQEIGYWVMKTALRPVQLLAQQRSRHPPSVGQRQRRQFHTAGFVQQVEYILRDTGVPPSRLLLEITESVVLENRLESIARIRQPRPRPAHLHRRLPARATPPGYLRDPPADEVKLDRSFIQTLVHSEQDKAIVKAILDLARVFVSPSPPKGWRKEQLAVLKALGCQHYQHGRVMASQPAAPRQGTGEPAGCHPCGLNW